ncbi:reverse transcriptase domain-containing protein, partial [endosymbiont of Tevnia jerichonana]|uniref:reverse transcriptase domain-containing protein n=1 Tax=endosymbiont of Tevnia jerichonana TaxID=94785 RepID=UPI0011104BF9
KRSTETQLIQTIHDISKSLDEKKYVDMAILDFTKAFDKVPHKRLNYKLKYYGITGPISSWLESFLTERTQQVVINGSTSEPTQVTSGVPQGTVWAPYFSYFI